MIDVLSPITERINVAGYTLFCHLTIYPTEEYSSKDDENANRTKKSLLSQPLVLHVTSSESQLSSLPVLIYAIPPASTSNLSTTTLPVTTALIGGQDSNSHDSVELATRLAKAIAKRHNRPVYVGAAVSGFLPQVETFEKLVAFVNQQF
ncbi:hypothetical protein V1511DRAFT_151080 [Dipodascopsis uninucleata]